MNWVRIKKRSGGVVWEGKPLFDDNPRVEVRVENVDKKIKEKKFNLKLINAQPILPNGNS